VLDEAERRHLGRPLGEEDDPEDDGDGVHRARHGGAEEDHGKIAEHLTETRLHAEELEREGIHDDGGEHRG